MIALLLIGWVTGSANAQEAYYSIFSFTHDIPRVVINHTGTELQESLYPEYYRTHSAANDLRWVTEQDSALLAFWQEQGDTILHILTELSGLDWRERAFDIYLVRYYPSVGSADPLILPVGGLKRASLTEAAPSGNRQVLNLVYQLSRRMLAQAAQPEANYYHPVTYHPLMRQSPYRRDNLAMLLALATLQNVIGVDSTFDAYRSAFWVHHHPGRRIMELYLLDDWALTPGRTLVDWILAEPRGSSLVRATRTPQLPGQERPTAPPVAVEGMPLKGHLGFSVHLDDDGYLMVDSVDQSRLAHAAGLLPNDRIRTVDGQRVRSHRALVERLLRGLDEGSALVRVLRNDELETLLFRPLVIEPPDSLMYPEGDYESDE